MTADRLPDWDWKKLDAAVSEVPFPPEPSQAGPRVYVDADIYTVAWDAPLGVQLDFDLLTTDRRTGETHAELTVYLSELTDRPERQLHRARVNLLSTTGRTTLAKYLAERDPQEHNWPELLEEAMQRVLTLYRVGEPAILLRDAPEPEGAGAPLVPPILAADGATILFGDGGTGKSYLALALAATLQTGQPVIEGLTAPATRRVGYLDWEWSAHVHRRRLARLCGAELPGLVYVPCRLPLREERDRLRRIIRDFGLEYLVIDSVALAAGGEPESAEVAISFFSALRSLGRDALLVAHVTNAAAKASADRPFGSAFWHNSARATWFAKAPESSPPGVLSLGLFNRKANDGPKAPAIGIEMAFVDDRVLARRTDVHSDPDFSSEIPIKLRMVELLATGALPIHEIATRLDVTVDAVKKAVQRDGGKRFVKVTGPDGVYRIGLATRLGQ